MGREASILVHRNRWWRRLEFCSSGGTDGLQWLAALMAQMSNTGGGGGGGELLAVGGSVMMLPLPLQSTTKVPVVDVGT